MLYKIQDFITQFENYISIIISDFANVLGIEDNKLILNKKEGIPKKGIIKSEKLGELKYCFHGVGCEVVLENGVIVDFDFEYKNGMSIYNGFDMYKLFKFIQSGNSIDNFEIEILRGYCNDLVKLGILEYKSNYLFYPTFIVVSQN